MDLREYLDLEALLAMKLQQEWSELADKQFLPISKAIEDHDWQAAKDHVHQIDMSEVGHACADFAYTVYRGAIDFGARVVGGGRSLTSSLALDQPVKRMVSQLLTHLEWSATLQSQKTATQLIADAEALDIRELVLKANPYHDELGRFTSRGRAHYHSIGQAFSGTIQRTKDHEARAKALGIPPAWKSVWINPDDQAALQATGVDGKGRKQYLYSAAHSQAAAAAKFERLTALNAALPAIRKALVSELKGEGGDSMAALRLIERTGIRVGSTAETQGKVKAYGATTLLGKHILLGKDGQIALDFVGKSGKRNTRVFKDKELHAYLSGRELSDDQPVFKTTDSTVRAAMKRVGGEDFSPKDFRTWHGTAVAIKALERLPKPKTLAEAEKVRKAVAREVSTFLNNTPAVALDSYINPAVFDHHSGGRLTKSEATPEDFDQAMTNFLETTRFDRYEEWRKHPASEPEDDQPEEESVQKAAKPVHGLTSFKQDTNQHLRLISSLHTSRLSSWGFLAEADMLGVTEYKLSAMLDKRTSEFCRLINGKVFRVASARTLIEQAVSAGDPNDLREIQPWPSQTKEAIAGYAELDTDGLVAAGLHLPPFHPGCRTLLVRTKDATPLQKPKPSAVPSLPEYVSTAKSFKDVGVKLSEAQVSTWNSYVGLNPADVLSALSGHPALDYLEAKKGTATIRVGKTPLVNIGWATQGDQLKFQGSLKFDPLDGSLKITKAQFDDGQTGSIGAYLKSMLANVAGLGKAVGAKVVQMPVAQGQAVSALALGFLPSATKYQFIRRQLLGLLKTSLAKDFADQTPGLQSVVLQVLKQKNEYGLAALIDLEFNPGFLAKLMAGVEYRGELDLFNQDLVDRLQ